MTRRTALLVGAGVALALAAGVYLRCRPSPPHPPEVKVEAKQETTHAATSAQAATSKPRARAKVARTTRDPVSGVVSREIVTVECEDETTQGQTKSEAQTATQAATATVAPKPPPERWWRVHGEASWRVRDLPGVPKGGSGALPGEVELGASVRVIGPLWVSAKVEADPQRIRDTAALSASARVEW